MATFLTQQSGYDCTTNSVEEYGSSTVVLHLPAEKRDGCKGRPRPMHPYLLPSEAGAVWRLP